MGGQGRLGMAPASHQWRRPSGRAWPAVSNSRPPIPPCAEAGIAVGLERAAAHQLEKDALRNRSARARGSPPPLRRPRHRATLPLDAVDTSHRALVSLLTVTIGDPDRNSVLSYPAPSPYLAVLWRVRHSEAPDSPRGQRTTNMRTTSFDPRVIHGCDPGADWTGGVPRGAGRVSSYPIRW